MEQELIDFISMEHNISGESTTDDSTGASLNSNQTSSDSSSSNQTSSSSSSESSSSEDSEESSSLEESSDETIRASPKNISHTKCPLDPTPFIVFAIATIFAIYLIN